MHIKFKKLFVSVYCNRLPSKPKQPITRKNINNFFMIYQHPIDISVPIKRHPSEYIKCNLSLDQHI